MRRLIPLLVLLVALCGFVPVAQGTESESSLSQCVQREGKLNVVVLMDQSGSLKSSDVDGARVDGLKSLVTALANDTRSGAGKPAEVRILFAGFWGSVEPNPSVSTLPWITLDQDNLDATLANVEKFRAENDYPETDYATAFYAASRYLTRGAQGSERPCRAIVFFTDGKFDLRDRTPGGSLPTTVPWANGLSLVGKGAGAKAVESGKRFLCRKGGLIDQLRRGADGVKVYAVGLSKDPGSADLDFLRSLASGDGSCGSETDAPVGDFMGAEANDLFFKFRDVIAGSPSEISSGSGSFVLARGIDSFLMRAAVAAPGTQIKLTGPRGDTKTIAFSQDRSKASVDGVELDVLWSSQTNVEVRGQNSNPEDSTGEWRFEFVGTSRAENSRYTLSFSPDISIKLKGAPVIVRGEETRLTFVALDARGEPIKWLPTYADAKLDAVVADPESGAVFPVHIDPPDPDGEFTGTVEMAREISSPSVNLNVAMALRVPRSKIAANDISSFSLRTTLPPGNGYPYFAPAEVRAETLSGSGTTSAHTAIRGSRSNDGCIWLESTTSEIEGVSRSVDVDGKPMPTTKAACKKIAAGSEHKLEVAFSTNNNDDLFAHEWVKFGVTSAADPAEEKISVDASAQFVHKIDVAQTIWLTVLFTLVGLGIPLILLALLNWLGAELAPPAMIRQFRENVIVDRGAGRVTDQKGDELRFDPEELTYVDLSQSDPVREMPAGPFIIESVAVGTRGGSLLNGLATLIRGPYAVARSGVRRVVGGADVPLSTWPDNSAQELPLGLSGSWVFAESSVRAGPDAQQTLDAFAGELIVFLGGEHPESIAEATLNRACNALLDIEFDEQGIDPIGSDESESQGGILSRLKAGTAGLKSRLSRSEEPSPPAEDSDVDLDEFGL